MNYILKKGRRYLLMFIDFILIVVTSVLSSVVLSILTTINIDVLVIYPQIILFSLFIVLGMFLLNSYKIVWRYAQIRNFLNLICGCIMGAFAFYLFNKLINVTIVEVNYLFSTCTVIIAVSLERIAYAFIYNYFNNRNSTVLSNNRVMIIGAGEAGKLLYHQMKMDKARFNPVVFVDDNSNKIGRYVEGLIVSGNTSEIPRLVKKFNVNEIVIAIPSIEPSQKTRILNICSETGCKVSMLPNVDEYVHNENIKKQMKPIKIEDLLGRDVVDLYDKNVNKLLNNKICMITGGGGSIGSELSRQVAMMHPKKMIIVDIYENNAYDIQQELKFKYGDDIDLDVQIASVRDVEKMEKLFLQYKPDVVLHAAAHKHVPLMETNPEEAVKNNVFGTYNIAYLSKKYFVQKFVLVSTDKAVNPTNVMGATKRCCEMIVECFAQSKSGTEFVAVRFGNVLGSNGSVIPLFERQIANGGPITVTDKRIIRYFMTIPEAASLILKAATLARGGEIFVLDMGEPVKILKLAENLIKLHGYKPYEDIKIEFCGLRPGEKLYEELLMNEEGLKETSESKIFIGKQIEINSDNFIRQLEKLREYAYSNDSENVVKLLREIVPTFVQKK